MCEHGVQRCRICKPPRTELEKAASRPHERAIHVEAMAEGEAEEGAAQ
jgi:hypothetical protein